MNNLLGPIKIKIENNWLKSGYYVYVAVIKYESKTYLYIGQTGDNHHSKARGPLFRISGHFIKTVSSDQNQIIKGFRDHIFKGKIISEEQLEIALLNSVDIEKIVVPDRQRQNQNLIDTALEQHWSVAFPDWKSSIKDAAEASTIYGKLYTIYSIINSRTNSELQINFKRKLLKG